VGSRGSPAPAKPWCEGPAAAGGALGGNWPCPPPFLKEPVDLLKGQLWGWAKQGKCQPSSPRSDVDLTSCPTMEMGAQFSCHHHGTLQGCLPLERIVEWEPTSYSSSPRDPLSDD
jgi:hypothetical protein